MLLPQISVCSLPQPNPGLPGFGWGGEQTEFAALVLAESSAILGQKSHSLLAKSRIRHRPNSA